MAFFPVSGATGDNMNELKNVLTAANAITTLYYRSTVALIFLSPYSNKVIKFTNTAGLQLIIGDAWTSGTTITNPIIVGFPYNGTFLSTASHAIITTADTLVFAISGGTNSSVIYIFSKFTDGAFMVCCTDSVNSLPSNYQMRTYNTTTMEQLLPAFYSYLMKSDTNYYHQFNPIWRTYLNLYYRNHQFTASVRELTRNADLGVGVVFEISGNDVIVPLRNFKDVSTYDQNTCLIIIGGNV